MRITEKMNYYNQTAKGYNELHEEEQLKKIRIIEENLEVSGSLLDIGAGTGISTKPFLKKATCFSLDPSEELLKQSPAIKVLGSAENLPFSDSTFDIIISVSAIHHFNLEKAILEIKRVSKSSTKYSFTILKKANNFENIKNLLKSNFNLREFEDEKDLILIS
ncbi:MAG: class I SAM-dependent methyltransferase [Candidatus Nanoarchaeia archaeon]|nr:class I SAM-dependent methyltransferase [Candidatus Nanoarchaeia archaeon]